MPVCPYRVLLTGCVCACALVLLPVAGGAQELPDEPHGEHSASLRGLVTDQDGSLLPGARVELTCGGERFETMADSEGEFVVEGLPAGTCEMRVLDEGFLNADESVDVGRGEAVKLTPVEMHPAGVRSDVTVVATKHDIAAAQMATEEKQRVFGVLPNFYTVYDKDPVPLATGQKFHLAWRSALDPVTVLSSAASAGIAQASNEFSGYGTGPDGYAKRFGASFADSTIATFLGAAVLPTVFHQDPRYYYQGTGGWKARAWHAVSSVVVSHHDGDGRPMFNYSNVFGTFASTGISNLYYPASNRNGPWLTIGNASQDLGFDAFSALMQEFVVRKLTPHLPSSKKKVVVPAPAPLE